MTTGRLAAGTVAVAAVLAAAKGAAAFASGSIGVASVAAEGALDLLMSLIVLWGVVSARRPADREHPYGHGKFENVAGAVESGLLAGVGVLLVFAGFQRVRRPEVLDITTWILVVLLVSMVAAAERFWRLHRAAIQHRSPALRVDAWHFAADFAATSAVLAGVLLTQSGLAWADGAASVVVGAFLLIGSVHVGWVAAAALVDRVAPAMRADIEAAVDGVAGVAAPSVVRVRQSGKDVFVDATVPVPRALSIEAGHEVARAVEDAVRARVPGADVVVHAEPVAAPEDVATTLKVLAARDPRIRGIHEIHVVELPEGLVADCHVEVGDVTVEEGHQVADRFEATACRTVPGLVRATTHIEPAREATRSGRDVTADHPEYADRVEAALRSGPLLGPPRLTVLAVDGRLELHVYVGAPPGTLLAHAHDAAEDVERLVRGMLPAVERVLVHVEPAADRA